MTPHRPFFLNLLRIRLPIGAVTSILHRASGAFLALMIPVLLFGLMRSLESEADFLALKGCLGAGAGGLLVLACAWALAHHTLAGLRHLGFDLGLGESRARSRFTAWLSLALGLALTLVVALGLWT